MYKNRTAYLHCVEYVFSSELSISSVQVLDKLNLIWNQPIGK